MYPCPFPQRMSSHSRRHLLLNLNLPPMNRSCEGTPSPALTLPILHSPYPSLIYNKVVQKRYKYCQEKYNELHLGYCLEAILLKETPRNDYSKGKYSKNAFENHNHIQKIVGQNHLLSPTRESRER